MSIVLCLLYYVYCYKFTGQIFELKTFSIVSESWTITAWNLPKSQNQKSGIGIGWGQCKEEGDGGRGVEAGGGGKEGGM